MRGEGKVRGRCKIKGELIDADASSSIPFIFPFQHPTLDPSFTDETWSFLSYFCTEIDDILQTYAVAGVWYVFYSLDFSRIWPQCSSRDLWAVHRHLHIDFKRYTCVWRWWHVWFCGVKLHETQQRKNLKPNGQEGLCQHGAQYARKHIDHLALIIFRVHFLFLFSGPRSIIQKQMVLVTQSEWFNSCKSLIQVSFCLIVFFKILLLRCSIDSSKILHVMCSKGSVVRICLSK